MKKDNRRTAPARRPTTEEARRSNSERHRRRRRKRKRIPYLVALMFLLTAGAVVSLRMFLTISEVVVEGETRYTAQELIQTSGLQIGENLFDFQASEIEKKILENHVYLETVKVSRRIPTKVAISVTSVQELGAVQGKEGFDIISTNGKVLSIGEPYPPSDLPIVTGVSVEIPEGQERIDFQVQKELNTVAQIVRTAEEAGLEGITGIDMSNPLSITVTYQERIKIELGGDSQIAYKLKMVAAALKQVELGAEGFMNAAQAGIVYFDERDIYEERNSDDSVSLESTEESDTSDLEGTEPPKSGESGAQE